VSDFSTDSERTRRDFSDERSKSKIYREILWTFCRPPPPNCYIRLSHFLCANTMSIRGYRLAAARRRKRDGAGQLKLLVLHFLDGLCSDSSLGGQRATDRRSFGVSKRVGVVTRQTCCISSSAPRCVRVVCDTSTDSRRSRAAADIGRRSPLPRRHVAINAPFCRSFVTFFVLTDGNFEHAIDDAIFFSGFH
jgi:hypothetical protein